MRTFVSGALAALVALVAVGYVVTRPEDPPSRLQVSVTGLPEGAMARVTVRKDEGKGTHLFTASDTRDVAAGKYTLTIAEVNAGGRRYLPADDTMPVTVRGGRVNAVVAAYRIVLSTDARVAPQENNPILRVDERRVTLRSGSYARSLKPGQIIVSGATRVVPSAFAAAVEEITPARDGNGPADHTKPVSK